MVVSCTFMIIDLFVIKVLIYSKNARPLLEPRINRWIQDSVLQYQRRAYEAHGQGTWLHLNSEIPTTSHMDTLLDIPIDLLPQPKSNTIYSRKGTTESDTTEKDLALVYSEDIAVIPTEKRAEE